MNQLDLFATAQPEPLKPYTVADEYRDGLRPEHYNTGHCWHYYLGGQPLQPEAIEAAECDFTYETRKAKRPEQIKELIALRKADLATEITQYREIIHRGSDALSSYDIAVCHSGNRKLALAGSLALAGNHISYSKGLIKFLNNILLTTKPT